MADDTADVPARTKPKRGGGRARPPAQTVPPTQTEAATHADFAARLRHLVDTVRAPGGGTYSVRDLAQAISQQGGETLSPAYIHMLLRGERDNPTFKHIDALAKFFGVPPQYFWDPETAATVDAQLAELAALRELKDALDDEEIRVLAVRARGLSTQTLQQIKSWIDHARSLERLDQKDGEQR